MMLCLNPQILDFMVAARGYNSWNCVFGNRHVHSYRIIDRGIFDAEDRDWRGDPLLHLFFSLFPWFSNLTFIVAAASLAISFFVAAFRDLHR